MGRSILSLHYILLPLGSHDYTRGYGRDWKATNEVGGTGRLLMSWEGLEGY